MVVRIGQILVQPLNEPPYDWVIVSEETGREKVLSQTELERKLGDIIDE